MSVSHLSRRGLLATGTLLALSASFLPVAAASKGFELYSEASFNAALNGPKPVLVHVHAGWCPVCKKQEAAFEALSGTPDFARVNLVLVDYDMEKAFLKKYNISNQSVILVFKGGKEVARSGGVTDKDKIAAILADAAK